MQQNEMNLDDIDYILISSKEKNRYYSCGGYSHARAVKLIVLFLIFIVDIISIIVKPSGEKYLLFIIFSNVYLISNVDFVLHNRKIAYRKRNPLLSIEANDDNLKKSYATLISFCKKENDIEVVLEIEGEIETYAVQPELEKYLSRLKSYDKVVCFFYSYKNDEEEILLFCSFLKYDDYYNKHILIASREGEIFKKLKNIKKRKKHRK